MSQSTYELIENLVNVTALANKWLMWAELESYEQIIYTPSVFQMRDGYFHLMKMFGAGINNNQLFVNNTGNNLHDFFLSDDTQYQLKEALGHSARAFFDISDYICIEIFNAFNKRNDLNKKKNSIIRQFKDQINELRSEKSNPTNELVNNVYKWDSILTVMTAIFAFARYWGDEITKEYNELEKTIYKIRTKFDINSIESFYKGGESFNESIKKLPKLKTDPLQYIEKLTNHIVKEKFIEDPIGWKDKIENEYSQYIHEIRLKKLEYSTLLNNLELYGAFGKAEKLQVAFHKIFYTVIPVFISIIFSPLISNVIFYDNVQQTQTNSAVTKTLNPRMVILCVIIFLVIFVLLLLIPWSIKKIMYKLKYSKYLKIKNNAGKE